MAGCLSIYTVDAFAEVPFEGNPAAVCPLAYDSVFKDDVLQNIAMEMNLSETAFPKLLSVNDSFKESDTFGLRWFTPQAEVALCGHATLASAAVLFSRLGNTSKAITFKTMSGDLIVSRQGESLHMDFPTGYTEKQSTDDYKDLIKSLGEIPGIEDMVYCSALKYLLVHLSDGWTRKQFEDWKYQIGELKKTTDKLILLIVTVKGSSLQGFVDKNGENYDFTSRCFAPWVGIPEDPVTGSAQTVLAHYWTGFLKKTDLYTRQASARGGDIRLKFRDDRVDILGKAKIVMEGTLHL